ncbi:uncharacterized protein M421DRAFT_425139, partial [Didymella exigua CBS 183.55]
MMCNSRETQRRLQVRDAKFNSERLRRESLRFLLAVAGSQFKKAENVGCEESGLFAPMPDFELDSWPHRMMMRFLEVLQLKPSVQTPKTPRYVSTLRRTLPSRRPHPPVCKMPRPAQGGFIENLEENGRYHDMLDNDRVKGVARRKKSIDALATEAMMESHGRDEEASTGRDEEDSRDGAATRECSRWDVFKSAIKGILCTAPIPPQPKQRLSKPQLEDAGEREQLLKSESSYWRREKN